MDADLVIAMLAGLAVANLALFVLTAPHRLSSKVALVRYGRWRRRSRVHWEAES